jgi:hypothetical protein
MLAFLGIIGAALVLMALVAYDAKSDRSGRDGD